jgi:hypothetical protein
VDKGSDQTPDPFGDFQTPTDLASLIWRDIDLTAVDLCVEPTVGCGAFLATMPAAARRIPWVAFDINQSYVEECRGVAKSLDLPARIEVANAFELTAMQIGGEVAGRTVLAVGNPPWVTNAAQGAAGPNLPVKHNRFGLRGLDALTGKANFDIAEAVLLTLMATLEDAAEVRLAFLLKRSVAMKMARHLLGAPGTTCISFTRIDAHKWFGASVEAGLFHVTYRPKGKDTTYTVNLSPRLGAKPNVTAGLVDGRFVENLAIYETARSVEANGDPGLAWRQGLKHDLSRVLELKRSSSGAIVNGLGESVDVEQDVLRRFYKSSDIASGRDASRLFPLYQHDLSGPLPNLENLWPKLAAYLDRHRDKFCARRSTIYANKPDFMLFGVGAYSLAPFKVVISGFYKTPVFRVLGPDPDGHPPLVDDTCYLLPFQDSEEAQACADYLNGETVQTLLRSLADRTAKRPYTKDLLSRIAAAERGPALAAA